MRSQLPLINNRSNVPNYRKGVTVNLPLHVDSSCTDGSPDPLSFVKIKKDSYSQFNRDQHLFHKSTTYFDLLLMCLLLCNH